MNKLFLATVLCVIFCQVAYGAKWHVTVEGTPSGNGSLDNPWDLSTAFNSDLVGANDTIFVHGGTYVGGNWKINVGGDETGYLYIKPYENEVVVVDSNDGVHHYVTWAITAPYVWVEGIIFTDSSTDRYSENPGSNPSWPDDLDVEDVLPMQGAHAKVVNCIFYNTLVGSNSWNTAPGSELSGCIIFNVGWDDDSRGHGHSTYSQGEDGGKFINNCIIYGGYGQSGIYLYGESMPAKNFVITDNIVFDQGNLSWTGGESNYFVGGFLASEDIAIKRNCSYRTSTSEEGFAIGGGSVRHLGLVFENNHALGGAFLYRIGSYAEAVFRNNIAVDRDRYIAAVLKAAEPTTYNWDNNKWFYTGTAEVPFHYIADEFGGDVSFQDWQALGLDANGVFINSLPSRNYVYVYPSKYSSGRGHVAIFNYLDQSYVNVDLSTVLKRGDSLYVYDAENVFGAPVVQGVYDGSLVAIPMDLTVVTPNAASRSQPHTGREFGCYIVKSTPFLHD
jgi:hypothetical protein